MGTFQKMLEKYHMDKWFQKENLVILILAGVLLAVIALPTKNPDEGNAQDNIYEPLQTELSAKTEIQSEDERSVTEKYVADLEERLALVLSKINGVGEVYVMITLQESEEMIVEKDLLADEEQTIYETSGSSSIPYVVKTIYPKVEGVAVVAEGAGTGKVSEHITEVIQALFNIELHKIKVTGS